MEPKLSNNSAIRIVTAAGQEFARVGFAGARVDRIAKAAGVNKQLLFYYYHSKRGLFQAVLKRGLSELEGALTTHTTAPGRPLDRLRDLLSVQFEYLADHPELVTLLGHSERDDSSSFAPAIRRLVVVLAEGQGLGQVRDDLDPHLTAAQALVLMIGYLRMEALIAASAPPLGVDESTLRERWKRAAVQLVLNGVRT